MTALPGASALADGIASRLGAGPRRRAIPFVAQLRADDCGACCLAMVLGHFGRVVRVDDVVDSLSGRTSGTDAATLCRVARRFGLRARGVKIDEPALPFLPSATILHWEFNHFVVFERRTRRGMIVMDPAFGRRHVSYEEVRRAFTGVALLFEPGEDFVTGGTRRAVVLAYLHRLVETPWPLLRVFSMSLVVQLLALLTPLLTGLLVDQVMPRSDRSLLLACGVGLVPLVAFHFLASFSRALALLELRTTLDLRVSVGFFEHLLRLPFSFFLKRPAGDLLQRMSSNALIREALTSGLMSSLLDGVFVGVNLVALVALNGAMAGVAVGLGGMQVALYWLTRRKLRDLAAQGLQAETHLQVYQTEIMGSVEAMKACGAEGRLLDRWSDLLVDVLNVSLTRGHWNAALDSLAAALRMASPMIVLMAGAQRVLAGELHLGAMLSLVAFSTGFLVPLGSLLASAMQMNVLGTYVDRVLDVLETPREQTQPRTVLVQPARTVTLSEVSFRYGPEAPLVIDDVSLTLRAGEFVAIVGRTASGKSTLARLLTGLVAPSRGRVLFDDLDLATLDLDSVRSGIGVVTQGAPLLGGSVRSNIALLDPGARFDQIVAAAGLAQIHEEILALPMGYETPLTGGGLTLSGGQRQRIALARALLRNPALLVLDEATSAVDAATEDRIQQAVEGLRCTRIVIAHRLSTVRNADRILVLERGRVVEEGTYDALVTLGGCFAALVDPRGREAARWRSA